MALREVEGPAGAPLERPLEGQLDKLVVESELLEGNPLGDPARRPLYVYRPPGVDRRPLGRRAERLRDHGLHRPARHVAQPADARADDVRAPGRDVRRGDCPAGVVVFVDAWTSVGGSQFLNSAGTGPYMDHLCDEVVPFVDERYPTLADREHRGLTGKSSGGYGAMVVPMRRPDVFGALASHAGDALWEASLLPDFPGSRASCATTTTAPGTCTSTASPRQDHMDWDSSASRSR